MHLTTSWQGTLAVCNGRGSITLDASTSYDPDAADKIARYVWEVRAARLLGVCLFVGFLACAEDGPWRAIPARPRHRDMACSATLLQHWRDQEKRGTTNMWCCCCCCCCCYLQVSSADVELNLQGSTDTVGAANGLYAGSVYEVEVYVSDSYGTVSEAATTLTGERLCRVAVSTGW